MSFTRRDGAVFETGDLVVFWDVHHKEPAIGRIVGAPGPICGVAGRCAHSAVYPYIWEVELRKAEHASAIDRLGELSGGTV